MASACSSSVSVQKSCTDHSSANTVTNRRKCDNELACSSNTRCFLQKKKPKNPLASSIRPPARQDNVRQRVHSAKLAKIRTLQSQLNDANYHLMELAQENRALKTTQRRTDKALRNYEGVNADLPRLIKSHEEENRVLSEKNRTMKKQLRDVTDLLKQRDDELLAVKDQLKHLTALAKDKHLEERQQLRDSLNEAKVTIKNYEAEISMLNRKLILEVKNCRQKVNAEVYKYKKCQQELAQAIGEIDRQNESKGRLLRRRFESPPGQRKSTPNLNRSVSKETIESSEIKLEPIKSNSGNARNSITSPVENIKARLSSTESRPHKIEDFHDILDKINMEEEFLKKSLQSGLRNGKIKPTKLETLVQHIGSAKKEDSPGKKVKHKSNQEAVKESVRRTQEFIENEIQVSSRQGEIITQKPEDISPPEAVINFDEINQTIDEGTLSDTEEIVQNHWKSLHESEKEFKRVQEELKEIAEIEERFGTQPQDIADEFVVNGVQTSPKAQEVVVKDDDQELVNEIWGEEFKFRKSRQVNVKNDQISTKEIKDPIVALEKKKQLLAALRDIDNGKSLDIDSKMDKSSKNNQLHVENKKSRLLKELFG